MNCEHGKALYARCMECEIATLTDRAGEVMCVLNGFYY